MLKHRGPILEHQTATLASLSDFSMENAINNSDFRFCLTMGPPKSPQAMVDLRLELGNKRFLAHPAAGERRWFSNFVSFSIIYYHRARRGHFPRQASFGDPRVP
jgi:hypothetical protein